MDADGFVKESETTLISNMRLLAAPILDVCTVHSSAPSVSALCKEKRKNTFSGDGNVSDREE